ncbi:XRE family transcriptional regulator [Microvirga sp. CF3062]|nr:XRE family transcriptional regulator [Microvirga sp. CF3062]MEE1658346.1 XRE family transcriptional regulator [Microvirga sp. CF3062]
MRREEAAHYLGVSPTKFDQLVADGRMPQPFRLDGCVLWDVRRLDAAIDLISNPDVTDGREIEL